MTAIDYASLLFFLWVIPAWLVAIYADKQQRPFWAFLLVSLVMGWPIVLLVLLATTPPNDNTLVEGESEESVRLPGWSYSAYIKELIHDMTKRPKDQGSDHH